MNNVNRLSHILLAFVFIVIFTHSSAFAETLSGTIRVFDKQGNPNEDASGVVVFLDEISGHKYKPSETLAIRQINKKFEPNILPVVIGTTVEFPNDDTIFHNVFSRSRSKPFDLGLYRQGVSKSVKFDQPGVVKVYCNIHPKMAAYVVVLGNSHFTVTDKDGNFTLKNLPAGKVNLRTWSKRTSKHPETNIRITKSGALDKNSKPIGALTLDIHEEFTTLKHKNKWGQNYPAKY